MLSGRRDAPLPLGPQLAPRSLAGGFLSSGAIPGRVIAGDLPSEPLTLRRGRPHLRSLSSEPHRPQTFRRASSPGALGGGGRGSWGLLSDLGERLSGCPPPLKVRERASPPSGLGTVTTRKPCPWWHGRGPGAGFLSSRVCGLKLASGGWSPAQGTLHFPPRESRGVRGEGAEELFALTQGGLQMSSKLTLSEWRAFLSKPVSSELWGFPGSHIQQVESHRMRYGPGLCGLPFAPGMRRQALLKRLDWLYRCRPRLAFTELSSSVLMRTHSRKTTDTHNFPQQQQQSG